eukprot:TRINITY_DN17832_c0_g1_i1.p1 TRINITY_DN17832_c0_g1~~TRINITY_DN17832_c0_g1_i1.p1  ORF type:complete len:268 (+),score=3.09 TRINITY_DN17832_c0_g1_i1:27-830(+)
MASHFQKHTQNSVHTMNQLCDKVHCWLMKANTLSNFPKTTEGLINALRSARLLFLREPADISSVIATLEDLGIVVRGTRPVHPKSARKGVTRTPVSFQFPSTPSSILSQHDNATAISLEQWAVERAIQWLSTRNRQSCLPSNMEGLTNDLGNVCIRQSTVNTSLLLAMLQHRELITITESAEPTTRNSISPGKGIHTLPLSQQAAAEQVAKRKERDLRNRLLQDRKRRLSSSDWGYRPPCRRVVYVAGRVPPYGWPAAKRHCRGYPL